MSNLSTVGVHVDLVRELEQLGGMHVLAMYRSSQVSADPLAAHAEADLLGFAAYEIGTMESLGCVAYIYQLQVVGTEQCRGYGAQLVERVRVQCASSRDVAAAVVNVHEANANVPLFYAAVCPPFVRLEGSESTDEAGICSCEMVQRW